MSIFRQVVEREEWELAALCLLLGTLEAASKLPRNAVVGLVKTLGVKVPAKGRSKSGSRG